VSRKYRIGVGLICLSYGISNCVRAFFCVLVPDRRFGYADLLESVKITKNFPS
jgi:hypothetical protein